MANLPLISPVAIVVEPLDTAATAYHNRAREPVKAVARGESKSFQAQISYDRRNEQMADGAGGVPVTTGYLITRQWMLDAVEYTPKPGDKITTIANRSGLALYLTSLEDAGHLDGGNTLQLLRFSSKALAR